MSISFFKPYAAQSSGNAELKQGDRDQIRSIISASSGIAIRIAEHDVYEVLARATLVRNTVEMDPDAPTLAEVREVLDAPVEELATDEVLAEEEQSL